VILVTDGDFNNGPAEVKRIIEVGQAWRKAHDYGEAVIMTFGVGVGATKQKHLADMGETWKGGFFVDENPAVQPEKMVIERLSSVAPVTTRKVFR